MFTALDEIGPWYVKSDVLILSFLVIVCAVHIKAQKSVHLICCYFRSVTVLCSVYLLFGEWAVILHRLLTVLPVPWHVTDAESLFAAISQSLQPLTERGAISRPTDSGRSMVRTRKLVKHGPGHGALLGLTTPAVAIKPAALNDLKFSMCLTTIDACCFTRNFWQILCKQGTYTYRWRGKPGWLMTI